MDKTRDSALNLDESKPLAPSAPNSSKTPAHSSFQKEAASCLCAYNLQDYRLELPELASDMATAKDELHAASPDAPAAAREAKRD